ncbi:MAG: hypothetical protein E7342_01615 [Clostridiales bacterium]|nr:hypothetical protein [Clostridiales bacterium]
MINTLKNKLILILVAITLVFGMAFLVNTNVAKATDGKITTNSYFVGVEGVNGRLDSTIENGKLTTLIKEDSTVKYFSKVAIDDFEMVFNYTDKIETLKIELTSKGFYKDEVTNVLTLKLDGTTLIANFNDGTNKEISSAEEITLKIKVEDGFILPTVNGENLLNGKEDYRVEVQDTTTANLAFVFDVKEETEFSIDSITQKATDSDYLQDFEVEGDVLKKETKPVIVVDNEFFSYDETGALRCVKYQNTTLRISWNAINVTPMTTSVKLTVKDGDGIAVVSNGDTSATFMLTKPNATLSIVKDTEVYKEVEITGMVKGEGYDKTAPVYNDDDVAIEQFRKELEKATKKEYTVNGKTEEHYIQIGENQKLTIPTMKSLVYDDLVGYSDLKYVVHYYTPSTSGETASLSIPIEEAGDYTFFVVFNDLENNKMSEEDFVEKDDDGKIIGLAEKYGKYVFNFTIKDDAPMVVSGATQENGFLNVKYVAESFDIIGADYNSVYKLYYRANESANWVEIPAEKKIDDSYDFTALKTIGIKDVDAVKKIAYDGKLTFTPTMKGEYKITCEISTTYSNREADGETFILVQDEIDTLNDGFIVWLENNTASFIFLTVGTLSLIGLIVVLCIKPKQKED